MKVYFAGAMEKKQNRGKQWRVTLGDKLRGMGWTVFDPVQEEDWAASQDILAEGEDVSDVAKHDERYEDLADIIWKRDMQLIKESDLMIVYLDGPVFESSGTLCEMSHAKDLGIPICILRKVALKDIPLWTRASFKDNFVTTKRSEMVTYLQYLDQGVTACSYQ